MDRAASRFIGNVRKALVSAAIDEKQNSGITQQGIAEKLGVNRSVINRLLRGDANLTLRSVAEIVWAIGWKIEFRLYKPEFVGGAIRVPSPPPTTRAIPLIATTREEMTQSNAAAVISLEAV
ncbi:helix-turn-helix domain-containing protein [Methyloferula stellata]|uniref:helix-turn-helix domain-containing protein n=1 Tax=Methyloferula stellata TaxID=876270 RepID=UPI00137621BC|nr:helix-turn-helix domain-containing protein [Methyloferula stellata]